MKTETKLYLEKVACIARANMTWQQQTEQEDRLPRDAGAAILMGAFLEMYDQYQEHGPGRVEPSNKVYLAASTCCEMRKAMERRPRVLWDDDEEGLFSMMLAYMFLFKTMYVVKQ